MTRKIDIRTAQVEFDFPPGSSSSAEAEGRPQRPEAANEPPGVCQYLGD